MMIINSCSDVVPAKGQLMRADSTFLCYIENLSSRRKNSYTPGDALASGLSVSK